MTRGPESSSERGFALLGAVMFVLVLTILALTLFSLSSFEAQFMRDSTDRAEAYHAALGGLERARFALTHGDLLASVKDGLPLDGVEYAVAHQNADTSDTPHWAGPFATEITIRVRAHRGNQVRFLEAKFFPSQTHSFYRNLATLSSTTQGLFVYRYDPGDITNPQEYNWKATYLSGTVVQNADNNPDVINPLGASTSLTPTIGGAPIPIVGSYIAQHALNPGTINVPIQQGSNPYILNALNRPDSIAFFRTPGPDVGGDWSLNMEASNPRFNVSGTCIWLFDRGLRVKPQLSVRGSGSPGDMLVLIGGRSQSSDPDDAGSGIALMGSIESPDVPVILISDADVRVEAKDFGNTWPDDNLPSSVGCMSIFANTAWIMGPDANFNYASDGAKLIFAHPANHPANAIIDRLVDLGYLPNTQGTVRGKLSPIAGSWREVNEPNPIFQ